MHLQGYLRTLENGGGYTSSSNSIATDPFYYSSSPFQRLNYNSQGKRGVRMPYPLNVAQENGHLVTQHTLESLIRPCSGTKPFSHNTNPLWLSRTDYLHKIICQEIQTTKYFGWINAGTRGGSFIGAFLWIRPCILTSYRFDIYTYVVWKPNLLKAWVGTHL